MLERSKDKMPYDLDRDPLKYNEKRIMEAADMTIQRNPALLPKLIKKLEHEDVVSIIGLQWDTCIWRKSLSGILKS